MSPINPVQILPFIHPGLFFISTAVILPFLPKFLIRWLLPIPAILAILVVVSLDVVGVTQIKNPIQYLGLTITFGRIDQLSIIFAHIFAIQALLCTIYALHEEQKGHHIAAMTYVGGAFGCIFAGDYLALFICWELMSIGSTMLIWLHQKNSKAAGAGFRYFLFHILGGLFLLAGLLLRYQALKTFAFVPIDPATAQYYDYLILLGFCVNAAVVPLHAWLPDAYPEATIPGAVFMSAFTTKTAVYVLARGFAGFEVLAIMGVVMCLWGVCYATIENNTRRILSYHIISQVGYMIAGIGIGTAMTINGTACHAYAHILYKGLLFMGAGALLHAAGTAKLTELGGLACRLPFVLLFYMIAAVSISGIPFFNGFISKNMTIAGAAQAHRTWLAFSMEIAAVGTFLSVGLKLPYFAFYAKTMDNLRKLTPIPWNMYLAMALSSILCLITGLFPDLLYRLLPFQQGVAAYSPYVKNLATTIYHPYTAWHLLQSLALLGFTGLGFYFIRHVLVPCPKLNLDCDRFYRAIGCTFLVLIAYPVAWLDGLWSKAYRVIGLGLLRLLGHNTSSFDRHGIDYVLDNSVARVSLLGQVLAGFQNGHLQRYAAVAVISTIIIYVLVWTLSS
ncbi:multicomponent Na+:H+ antiporter subunit D [Desulfovibrionales bacterium]